MYDPHTPLKSEPAWVIGKEKRDSNRNNQNPGPGSYNKFSTLAGPKWVFGSEDRVSKAKDNFPGPGTYSYQPTIPDMSGSLNTSV